jgi:succinate dehydrogenase / fumarate reductase, cytochrome b subunit
MANSSMLQSSIAKKVAMALSGLFLMLFLTQHFFINMTSVFSEDTFNSISHFMGHNPLVQFVIQPILIVGVVFHFCMGIYLDYKNKAARPIKYASYKGSENANWASRNMIVSGLVVLAFLGLHFYDFWIPEMDYKYISQLPLDETRYYPELVHKFENPVRVGLYCLSFILLSLHLWHGFTSSFQSVGARRVSVGAKNFSYAFAIIIPFGFVFIALFHYFLG